jgi:Holliday junction resolvase RusA-like endonuclease
VELIRLTIPGVPPSLNRYAGRENTWEYREAKKKWTEAVQWAVKAARAKPERPFAHAAVTLTYYFPTNARHDADNYAGKFLLDGLTRAGVIVDDDLKHITTMIIGNHDAKNPRTEIYVEKVTTRDRLLAWLDKVFATLTAFIVEDEP